MESNTFEQRELTDKISPNLLGRKGELLVTNRLLKDYEVFFPYFDRGVDLVVKKKDVKKFFAIQCKTRDFRGHNKRNLTIQKAGFERMKANVDFLVFILYFGEDKSRFVLFPTSWLEKIIQAKNQIGPVKRNYILAIKHKDGQISYKPKEFIISDEELDISRFVDEKGWQQLE